MTTEQKLEIAVQALKAIRDPWGHYAAAAKARGGIMDTFAVSHLVNTPGTYHEMATKALQALTADAE